MAKTILRAGKIAAAILITTTALAIILYTSGVLTKAQPAPPPAGANIASPDTDTAATRQALQTTIADYLKADRFTELETLCNDTIARPADAEEHLIARQGLAQLYIRTGQHESADAAVEDLTAQFAAHPRIARALCEVADTHRQMRQFPDAERLYRYVTDNYPDNPYSIWPQKNLCTLYVQLGDESARDEALDRLLTRYSDHPQMPLAICSVADELAAIRKDYQKARELYTYAADNFADNEQSVWAQKNLCRLLIERLHDTDAAETQTDKLLQDFADNPNLPAAVLEVADAWRSKNHTDRAMALYELIAVDYPKSEQALWAQKNICTIFAAERDETSLDEAVNIFTTDFGDQKAAPLAICGIGDACADAALFDKAEQLYNHVLATYPNNESALWARKNICTLYIRTDADELAETAIDQLAADFTTDDRLPQALCEIADAYRELGNRQKATQIYNETIARFPAHNYALWARQNLIRMQIEDDVASENTADQPPDHFLDSIDSFITDFPGYPGAAPALCQLGEIYYKAGASRWQPDQKDWVRAQFGKASLIFDRVITDSPFDAVFTPDAYYMSADLFSRIGDFAGAVAYHQVVADNWPDHHLAWSSQYWVGTFSQKLRNNTLAPEEADTQAEQAFLDLFEKYPDNPMAKPARSQLAMIYFKKHQWQKAAALYEQIVGESPPGEEVPRSTYYLAKCYEKIDQKEMAIQTYREFAQAWPESSSTPRAIAAADRLGGTQR